MANKTSLIIKSVGQDNKATSRSITDVSKTATAQQLKAFAQALNATSDNTYQSSSRVQTTDLDNVPTKLPRNMQLAKYLDGGATVTVEASLSNANANDSFLIIYAGEGQPKFQWENDGGNFCTSVVMFNDSFKAVPTEDLGEGIWAGGDGHITVSVDANDTYEAGELVITVTGGNS